MFVLKWVKSWLLSFTWLPRNSSRCRSSLALVISRSSDAFHCSETRVARLIFMVGLRLKPFPARSLWGWERDRDGCPDVGAEREERMCWYTSSQSKIECMRKRRMNDTWTSSLPPFSNWTLWRRMYNMHKYHGWNKTQSKVILLSLSMILHGSVFSQKTSSRIS